VPITNALPFLQFFSRRAVFDQAELVQTTVTMLLDHAEMVARKNQGAFDFKKDFAFQFPIRIICGMVGISDIDILKVQRWTEESTRSMDTEAGDPLRQPGEDKSQWRNSARSSANS
jgi:cytochrome P450